MSCFLWDPGWVGLQGSSLTPLRSPEVQAMVAKEAASGALPPSPRLASITGLLSSDAQKALGRVPGPHQ